MVPGLLVQQASIELFPSIVVLQSEAAGQNAEPIAELI